MKENQIPTYKFKNQEEVPFNFTIKKMEKQSQTKKGIADAPHRHNYYTILFVIKGKGTHKIDFKSFELTNNQIFFIAPGQVHQLIETSTPEGYVMLFSREFLVKNTIDLEFFERINLFNEYGNSPPLSVAAEQQKRLLFYIEEMIAVLQEQSLFAQQALNALLINFLIICNQICDYKNLHPQYLQTGTTLIKKFKDLVENKHTQWHYVKQYAEKLNITPDYLNKIIKSLISVSAKEYLQNRIILSAKRLLLFSELSQKEIAYNLGFTEPGNFSAFFKNCTDMSPSQFIAREQ